MNQRQKVSALVLSQRNIGEADRLVTLLTRESGLTRAYAKGVRKIPSSRGGHLEPLTKSLVIMSTGRAGTYISAAETEEYFADLRANPSALQHATNIALVVTRLFEEHDDRTELFDTVYRTWRLLPELSAAKQHVLECTTFLTLLREAGLMPELNACRASGVSSPQEAVILDARQGGWHVLSQHSGFVGSEFSVSPRLLRVLRFISATPEQALRLKIKVEESNQLLRAMRRYIADVIELEHGLLTT